MFDLIIANGTVIDGTGAARARADVGISGDVIAAIGDLSRADAARRIDATARIVAPGFVDIHTHSDTSLLINPLAESAIRQGVTTQGIGHCGHTVAPIDAEHREQLRATLSVIDLGIEWQWETFAQLLDAYSVKGIAINIAPFVGHCAIRADAMGFDDRPATPDELAAMSRRIDEAMDAGAWGMSVGLMYPPSMYAGNDELIALCTTLARRGGIFATHMRSYSNGVVESVEETCDIARQSGVSVQIAHLAASGRANWGKVAECLRIIDALDGQVHADKYPYTAGAANLSQRLPAWAHDGGAEAMLARLADPDARARIRDEMASPAADWKDNIAIDFDALFISYVASDANKPFEGKSVAGIAALRGGDPYDVVLDLILEERNRVNMIAHSQSEEETCAVMTHRYGVVGSDGLAVAPYGPLSEGKPHPRYYGTFPRVLGHFVRDKHLMPLEQAVHKISGLPAGKLGLDRRGTLAVGHFADVCVFDPETIIDRATYDNPHQYPDGVDYVIVNGSAEIDHGHHNETLKGKVLRKR